MIQLYIRHDCPFCRKVVTAAENLGLTPGEDFITIDAAPGTGGRETVLRLGGRAMVPFLVDGPLTMYESDDIIAYLKQKRHRG